MPVKIPDLEELFQAGAYFGHKKERSSPGSKPVVFAVRSGINIINLNKTQEGLELALKFLESSVKDNKTILFVGTKPQAQEIVKKVAQETGFPYINHKWSGGTLTNFETTKNSLKHLRQTKEYVGSPEFEALTKKEKGILQKKLDLMLLNLGGIQDLKELPDVLLIVDPSAEKVALREAERLGIPTVAICDTDTDLRRLDYPIPANDDTIKAVDLLMGVIGEGIFEAQKKKTAKGNSRKEIG